MAFRTLWSCDHTAGKLVPEGKRVLDPLPADKLSPREGRGLLKRPRDLSTSELPLFGQGLQTGSRKNRIPQIIGRKQQKQSERRQVGQVNAGTQGAL